LDSVTQATVLDRINASGARILIVCMGMPLQERWILDNLPRLSVSLVLNGGSALDYVAGMKKRCPPWMGAIGMEWVYRLLQEPGRLWKRYLLGNPRFIIRVLLSRLNA
jgi:N-acetylglucosaminyldiphosphoundecaprenol N-acetyl-beta-D-mannosaminyltransferase